MTGSVIGLEIDITANHKGSFQLKLCPLGPRDTEATQACLDAHPLTQVDAAEAKARLAREKAEGKEREKEEARRRRAPSGRRPRAPCGCPRQAERPAIGQGRRHHGRDCNHSIHNA